MGKLKTKTIKEKAEHDFETTWLETTKQLNIKGKNVKWNKAKGQSHPVIELASKIRQIFLSYGFEEILNSSIIEEQEVYKQYCPEAAGNIR